MACKHEDRFRRNTIAFWLSDEEKAASEIRKAFPRYAREVRVVRDRINAR